MRDRDTRNWGRREVREVVTESKTGLTYRTTVREVDSEGRVTESTTERWYPKSGKK